MLLVLVKVKCVLDLVTKALAIRGFGVASMLLLVDIACAAALCHSQPEFHCRHCQERTPVWNSS